MAAAIDNVPYFSFVEHSTNSTLKLVHSVIKNGVTQQVLLDRALILKSFLPTTCQVQTNKRVLSILIDAHCCVQTMATNTLDSEPSVHHKKECSDCGRTTSSEVVMEVNFKTIRQHGFSALEKALIIDRSPTYNVCCLPPCTGRLTWFREPNIHLLVMLDIRENISYKTGMMCALKQIPVTLKLPRNGETTFEYRCVSIFPSLFRKKN